MRTEHLLVCLPLWLACGGPSTQAAVPEPGAAPEEEEESLIDFDPETLVHFELVADVDKLQVGAPAKLGALFQIEEGWHIYWINPGESGLPTKFTMSQAEGLSVEAARFPGPARFDSNDEIVNYGYHHALLVPMQVRSVAAGEAVELVAEARWLACRVDACVPGKGSASLLLERGQDASVPSKYSALFRETERLLPGPFRTLGEFGVEAEIVPDGDRSRLTLRAKDDARLEIFPIHDEAITDLKSIDAGVQFTLHAAGDNSELAVLSVSSDSATHFFSITSELLAASANKKGTP